MLITYSFIGNLHFSHVFCFFFLYVFFELFNFFLINDLFSQHLYRYLMILNLGLEVLNDLFMLMYQKGFLNYLFVFQSNRVITSFHFILKYFYIIHFSLQLNCQIISILEYLLNLFRTVFMLYQLTWFCYSFHFKLEYYLSIL